MHYLERIVEGLAIIKERIAESTFLNDRRGRMDFMGELRARVTAGEQVSEEQKKRIGRMPAYWQDKAKEVIEDVSKRASTNQ